MRALLLLATATACMGMRMPGHHSVTSGSKALRDSDDTRLGDIIQEFGLDVSVKQQNPSNVVISPLSISALLSVLMMGSAGRSHLELRRALHFPDTLAEDDIHDSFQRLMDNISSNGPHVTLNIANGLFVQRGARIIYNFTQMAHKYYNSVASTLDFRSNPHASKETLNKWVKQSTSGMIPNLFTQPLDPMTTFVAINTVFFNGKWDTPFLPELTRDREFDTGSRKIMVPIMSARMYTKYVNIPELNAHMAALPYKGGRQAMYIILPKGPVTANLEPLEKQLTAERLNSLISNMNSLDMRVWLPRMRLNFKTSLQETLVKLGMRSIFNPATADFSRLTSVPVWVDDVLHETVIEVTEEGTKAAAATGSVMTRSGTSNTFIVNRPAIFFIRDEESGVPLFWGKLVEPQALRSQTLTR